MFIDAGQTKIFADIRGEGEPIVILHGLGDDHRSMAAWMEQLFTANRSRYQRIYLDLPGMGQSPVGDWIDSSDRMLDAVAEAIESIIPGAPLLLCGFSYGSYIVQGLVHRLGSERVRGVALIGPLVKPYERELPPKTVLEQDTALLNRLSAEERAAFERVGVLQTEPVWDLLLTDVIPGTQLADRVFLMSEFKTKRYAFGFDAALLPDPCVAPSLIVCGRQDHIAGYKNALVLLDAYPRAAYHILDRAGHYLMIEQREMLQQLTTEWLDRVTIN